MLVLYLNHNVHKSAHIKKRTTYTYCSHANTLFCIVLQYPGKLGLHMDLLYGFIN